MSFWGELRRRNVVRVGIACVVVSWPVIQVADTFLPWTVTFVAALLILGLPVALALGDRDAGDALTRGVPRRSQDPGRAAS